MGPDPTGGAFHCAARHLYDEPAPPHLLWPAARAQALPHARFLCALVADAGVGLLTPGLDPPLRSILYNAVILAPAVNAAIAWAAEPERSSLDERIG